jgi:hypothetical protein
MKRVFSFLSAALAVLILAVSSSPASAIGSSSLSLQPRKNYVIKPGQTITDKLTVGNLDKTQDLSLSLRMIDFTFNDQSGTPKLALAQNAPQTPWSLKPFTKLPKSITVPKGGSTTFSYTITLPKNQGAGSYYSAVLYQAGGANGGNVALNASGVSLLFASVPGKVNENMTLQKFGAYNSDTSGASGSYVFIDINEQPKMVAYTLKNEGNVFESPAGSVTLTDTFGHHVADVPTNTNLSLALLGQTRLFTSCIKTVQDQVKVLGGTSKDTRCVDPGLKPGRYTAKLDVFYGQNGNQTHEITAVAHFWYLPLWFIVLVLVIVALIAFGVWWSQRKLRQIVKGTSYKAGKGITRRKR